jgi:phosphoglucosamine mutase
MTRLPQVLVNVAGVDKSRAATDPEVVAAVAQAESELAGQGRVLLRPSGTEALVRVMVEAPTAEQADAVARELAGVVERALALR